MCKLSILSRNKGKKLLFLLNLFTQNNLFFTYTNRNYCAIENGGEFYFISTRSHLYLDGAIAHSTKLAKSYGLDLINFNVEDYIIDVGTINGDLLYYCRNFNYIGFEPSQTEYKLLVLNLLKIYGFMIKHVVNHKA